MLWEMRRWACTRCVSCSTLCCCWGCPQIPFDGMSEVHTKDVPHKQPCSAYVRECPHPCLGCYWGVAKGSSVSWVAKFKGDKKSECKLPNGRSRSYKVIRLLLSARNEWSQRYREKNQHPSLPWSFITHGFLDPSAFPELHMVIPSQSPVDAAIRMEEGITSVHCTAGNRFPTRRAFFCLAKTKGAKTRKTQQIWAGASVGTDPQGS